MCVELFILKFFMISCFVPTHTLNKKQNSLLAS